MKKAFYGPYYRFLMKTIHGKKIIGKASRDELEDLAKVAAKGISKVDNKRTEADISNELMKKWRIVYTEKLPRFSGTEGFALGSKMFIDKEDVDKIIGEKPDNLIDKNAYHTIIHESIHTLQQKLTHKGKSIRGFVEGATDLMALRVSSRNRSCYNREGEVNFPPTPYINLVSIIAQLEVICGEEIVEKFALSPDVTLMDRVAEIIGQENYEELRKDMNAEARGKQTLYGFDEWQNILLTSYFDKTINNVTSQEEAEQFLDKLKSMEKVRIRIKGDTSYQEYYLKTLEQLKAKYPGLDVNKYEYKECEFYPALYWDEMVKKMDQNTLFSMPVPNSVEEFRELKLEDYQRYRLVSDRNIFEIITHKGKINTFSFCNSKGMMKDLLSHLVMKGVKVDDVIKEIDGKIYIVSDVTIDDIELPKQELEEIPLNVSKKDIYNEMLKVEEDSIKFETFFEKIKRKFSRQKMLPPYSEVREASTDKSAWELTPEQKKVATEPVTNDNISVKNPDKIKQVANNEEQQL